MPFPPPSRIPSGPRRRSLLVSAAGSALLVGCSAWSGDSDGPGGSGSRPSAADRARARAARDSEELVARYDAVLAAYPGLAGRLRPLRAETVRHAEAFGGGRKGAAGAESNAEGERKAGSDSKAGGDQKASASVSPSVSPPAPVPGNEKDALAELAAAERALADRRAEALLAVPGELARLLASVAAAGAGHVYLLTER
ncbi:hypothetical protein [Streptomyces sp. TRM68367]|uniref:hypothetical protein n=1 Tax=Streptomyces sp. TRM68367 TaxID=2758415 RepID=UPI00165A4118|nr:hypothetical protein [Streptomyces sp. TRM68367]MBC9723639.1 hypothetical protein [Streptomyces sp. TRM68367]